MSAPYDLALKGGTIVTAEGRFAADLGLRDGKIAAIGDVAAGSARVIDASHRLILPGGVDPHAHIEQMSGMGLMNADTWETATRSAAMGGTTSVIAFAAQARGQTLSDAVADYTARAARGALIDHAFHLMVTDTSVPDFDADLAALIDQGHRSIKVFTTYNIRLDDADILRVMAIARSAGALVCVHAENHAMIESAKAQLLADGKTRPEHHALSHPRLAEIEAVQRMIRFAEHLDQPVMLFHLSTGEATDAVRGARRRGIPVWSETCPHYLLMTDEVLKRDGIDGAKWMCSPPQRGRRDQAALWAALDRRDIQLVSSDHAPYRFDDTGKLRAGPAPRFDQIANGLPGLETRLPLLFDAMVSKGRASAERFVEVTATAPARIYGLATKGRIAPGLDADLVLWDPDRQVTYGPDDLHDNVGYNPWEGTTVTGWPDTVIRRGDVIVQNGTCHATPGSGRWLSRDTGPQAKGKA